MGKKAPKQTKAALNKHSTATDPKQTKQHKKKREISYDSLRDPLDRELALVGLRVKQITADGNCFFRALSDQLEGNEGAHSSLRARVVDLMRECEEDFAPFVEDDQSFSAYIARMRKEGVWAGHMELQAASLLLKANIHIYQAGQPRWAIVNFPSDAPSLHLSYHDGEHYNSVRRADDYGSGPPAAVHASLAAAADNAGDLKKSWSDADEATVMTGTGCENKALIRQQLAAAGGDVDAAIEAVIEILAGEEYVEAQQQQQQEQQEEHQQQQQGDTDLEEGSQVVEGQSTDVVMDVGGSLQHNTTEALQHTTTQGCEITAAAAADVIRPSANGIEASAMATANSTCTATPDVGTPALDGTGGHQNLSSSSSSNSSSSTAGSATALAVPGSNNDQQQQQQQQQAAAVPGKKGVKLKGGRADTKAKCPAATAAAGGVVGRQRDGGVNNKRVSRNKPCPCGSGRKYKNCCEVKGVSSSAAAGAAAVVMGKTGAVGVGGDGLPAQLTTLHI